MAASGGLLPTPPFPVDSIEPRLSGVSGVPPPPPVPTPVPQAVSSDQPAQDAANGGPQQPLQQPQPPPEAPTDAGAATAGCGSPFGVIYPPVDSRAIIDKTAQFVAKNGPDFERRVMRDQGSGQKFAFLSLSHPFRAYYELKVKEFSTGEAPETPAVRIPKVIQEIKQKEAAKKTKKEKILSLTQYSEGIVGLYDDDAALRGSGKGEEQSAIEDEKEPEAPPPDFYTVPYPYAAEVDVEVMKLTAQFVSRNGQKFLVGLTQRERGNAQFDFLKATHPLFPYFTSLVEAYSRTLLPGPDTLRILRTDVGLLDPKTSNVVSEVPNATDSVDSLLPILDRCLKRYRWDAYQMKLKLEKERKDEEERAQMQTVDWHDFVVVEVVDFTEKDDELPLNAPIGLVNLRQPPPMPPLASNQPSSDISPVPIVEVPAAAVRDEDMVVVIEPMLKIASTQEFRPIIEPPRGFSSEPFPPPVESGPPPVTGPTPAPIIIRKDYQRVGKRRGVGDADSKLQKCPITGQLVPANQMSEHLRILLLDPKWKEQKDKLLNKAKSESAFAVETDFEANLANFVAKRPDLFGTVEQEVLEHTDELTVKKPKTGDTSNDGFR